MKNFLFLFLFLSNIVNSACPSDFLNTINIFSYEEKDVNSATLVCLEKKDCSIYTLPFGVAYPGNVYGSVYANATGNVCLDADNFSTMDYGDKCLFEILDSSLEVLLDDTNTHGSPLFFRNYYKTSVDLKSSGSSCPDDLEVQNDFFLNSDFSSTNCWGDTHPNIDYVDDGIDNHSSTISEEDGSTPLPFTQLADFLTHLNNEAVKTYIYVSPTDGIEQRFTKNFSRPFRYVFRGNGRTVVFMDSISPGFNLELVNYAFSVFAEDVSYVSFGVPVDLCYDYRNGVCVDSGGPTFVYGSYRLYSTNFKGCLSSLDTSFLVNEINAIKESNLINFENVKNTIDGLVIELTESDYSELKGLSLTSFNKLLPSDFLNLSNSNSNSNSNFDINVIEEVDVNSFEVPFFGTCRPNDMSDNNLCQCEQELSSYEDEDKDKYSCELLDINDYKNDQGESEYIEQYCSPNDSLNNSSCHCDFAISHYPDVFKDKNICFSTDTYEDKVSFSNRLVNEVPLFTAIKNMNMNTSRVCSPFSFINPITGNSLIVNAHCSILNPIYAITSIVFLLVWSIYAVRILISSKKDKV